MEITVNSIINKSTHKNLEGSGSDTYSNTAVWKVKQIYPNFPSGFYCKRIKHKSHGGKQSTITLKTLTRKEIYPTMLNTSECNGFFSLFWNFQCLLEFGILLLLIPCHYSHLIHLSNSNSYESLELNSLLSAEVFTMFNRTSLQFHIPPVSVTGQSHGIFLTEQKFNPQFHKINSWRLIKLPLYASLHRLWNMAVGEGLGRRVKKVQNGGGVKRQFQQNY